MSRARKTFVLLLFAALLVATAACKKRNGCMPEITKQPGNAAITKGQSITLSVTANVEEGGQIGYQWYELGPAGSILLPNQTSASVTVKPEKTTTYFAWVYTKCGETREQKITDSAVVTVR